MKLWSITAGQRGKCHRASSALVIFFLLLNSHAVYGHTSLVSSSPSPSAIVEKSPPRISLTFSEKLILIGQRSPHYIRIFDQRGNEIKVRNLMVKDRKLIARLPKLSQGEYRIEFRVTSKDGHPITGKQKFQIRR